MNNHLIKRIPALLFFLLSLVYLYTAITGYLSQSSNASGEKVGDILNTQGITQTIEESPANAEDTEGKSAPNPTPYLRLSLAKAFGIVEKDDLSGREQERILIIHRDPSASGSKADYILKGIVVNNKGVSAVFESTKSHESHIVRKGDTVTLKMPDGSTADWQVAEIHNDMIVLK